MTRRATRDTYTQNRIALALAARGGGAGMPGSGVPITVAGTSLVVHIDPVAGVDAPATDGSAAHPGRRRPV